MCGHDQLITQRQLNDAKTIMSLVFGYNGCELKPSIKKIDFLCSVVMGVN
jgi:hypothetical protein